MQHRTSHARQPAHRALRPPHTTSRAALVSGLLAGLVLAALVLAGMAALSTSAVAAGNTPTLRGTQWALVAEGSAGASAGTDAQRAPHLQLDPAQMRVSGYSGCNRMFGNFELQGSQLRFAGLGGTRRACLEGMDVEQRFLEALQAVQGWRIAGQELLLTGADGATLLRFQASAEEAQTPPGGPVRR